MRSWCIISVLLILQFSAGCKSSSVQERVSSTGSSFDALTLDQVTQVKRNFRHLHQGITYEQTCEVLGLKPYRKRLSITSSNGYVIIVRLREGHGLTLWVDSISDPRGLLIAAKLDEAYWYGSRDILHEND